MDYDAVQGLIVEKRKEQSQDYVPLEVLSKRPLGILEALTKFLYEERKLSFNQIAKMINRDNRTIWSAYHTALRKNLKKVLISKSKISIPINIFSDRRTGLLEVLSLYLKDVHHMTFKEIGIALNRDSRTIWTSYRAAGKKRMSNEESK